MINDYSGFAHVLDSLHIPGKLPIEIIPGHEFRRATDQEIDRIKIELKNHRLVILPYEHRIISLEKGYTTEQLPPNKWKYYVISFKNTNDKLRTIEYAANLLKNDISLGYTFFNQFGGVVFSQAEISTFFIDHYIDWYTVKSIKRSEIHEINHNYNMITNLDSVRYPNIIKALSDFHQTKMITNRSILKVLSYFSIIECLLTHPPRPIDTIDSITRQISTKMSLLSKRFQRELEYNLYFPSLTDSEKLWKKLYSYRSQVAHGGNPDFSKQFLELQSHEKIRLFLFENLKLLLLYTLKEPEFISDLQKC
jgi:hypothetical protein